MAPCVKTVTYFGFPFLTIDETIDYAYAKLYFKNIVKVTEDFVSYDLLRWLKYFEAQLKCVFSMIAEIGGYSGLLIGFSMMDLVVILKYFLSFSPKF